MKNINCQFNGEELGYILDGLRLCESSFIVPEILKKIKAVEIKVATYYTEAKKEEINA